MESSIPEHLNICPLFLRCVVLYPTSCRCLSLALAKEGKARVRSVEGLVGFAKCKADVVAREMPALWRVEGRARDADDVELRCEVSTQRPVAPEENKACNRYVCNVSLWSKGLGARYRHSAQSRLWWCLQETDLQGTDAPMNRCNAVSRCG